MAINEIKNLLKETMGFSAESIGDSSIERAINQRKDALNLKDTNTYLSLLRKDGDELNELVEEVVVPETWFFRNLAPFESLPSCIQGANERKEMGNTPLRILSLPCSTGEEPYSIAITLMETGLKENDFQIDAQDISKRALRKARRAIYGKHSFREPGKFNIEKYFRKTHSGQQLLPIIRDRVNFIRSNVLKDMIIPEPEYYDVIFCRNLLIYFDRKTKKNVLEKIHFMLKPGGTLFVGHAETAEVDKKLFAKINKPKAFAYTKKVLGMNYIKEGKNEHTNQLINIYKNLVAITKKDVELSKRISSPGKKQAVSRKEKNPVKKKSIWKAIEKMIEKGRLKGASDLCEKRLKDAPHDAQIYYYLAIVSNIEGGTGAAELLLKKAVYLDPNHHKALSLFCLLAEKRGDKKLAHSLKRRESRARKRVSTF